jgi:8-oxo-dGTP pyrophosphatase MutT (NUDIX family)
VSAPLPREETSAGGIVMRRVEGIPHYLLIRDSYRNWGFPKGHLEDGESAADAACREVTEETGLRAIALRATLDRIDWHFRFRGTVVHKTCHFFLMETDDPATCPQVDEGITACRWAPFDEAVRLLAYENARVVLRQAHGLVADPSAPSSVDAAHQG